MMTRRLRVLLIFVALSFVGAMDAAQAADPVSLDAVLAAHASQCAQFGCPDSDSPWLKFGVALIFPVTLVLVGMLAAPARVYDAIERKSGRGWLAYIGISAFIAMIWVGTSMLAAWLSASGPFARKTVASLRYKDATGHWIDAPRREMSLSSQILDALGEAVVPVFLIVALSLLVLRFALPRLSKRKLIALLATASTVLIVLPGLDWNKGGQKLQGGPLRDRIEAMAAPLGYSADIVRLSHDFTFLHNARARSFPKEGIWLSSTLPSNLRPPSFSRSTINNVPLKPASDRQVSALIGHELAHLQLGHHYRLTAIYVVSSLIFSLSACLIAFHWTQRWTSAEPTLMRKSAILLPLLLGGHMSSAILTSLTVAWQSRHHERQADATGLTISGDPEGFAQIVVVMNTGKELDQPAGPFDTHPLPLDRIATAMGSQP